MKGKFIVIEGMDGVGKDKLISHMQAWLASNYQYYINYREPGGSDIGPQVRHHICHNKELNDVEQATLLMADRLLGYKLHVKPATECGRHVLASRYFYTTQVYQRTCIDYVNHLVDVLDLDKVDRVIYVHADTETIRQRILTKDMDHKETTLVNSDWLDELNKEYDKVMANCRAPVYLFDATQPLGSYPQLVDKMMRHILSENES